MLLNDKKRLVEVYMENVVWGNIKMVSKSQDSDYSFEEGESETFRDDCKKWCELRVDQPDSPQVKELTDKLYRRILEFRIVGLLVGKFEDPDYTIEQLKAENEKLAGHLSQSYIPSKDPKIGTT